MTTQTTNTATIDDLTAISLLVTAFNNPKIAFQQLPESIQLQAVEVFKQQCAERGVEPTQGALAVYVLTAWANVSEIDKPRWMARLIEVCGEKAKEND